MSKGAIIDAEIVALHEKGRASFHLLGAYDINQQRPPIFLYAFDLLQLNGEDLKSFPWSSGKRALQKRISKLPGVIRYFGALGIDAEPLLEEARKLSLKGVIGKEEFYFMRLGSEVALGSNSNCSRNRNL
jgi:bifunctional non-homologous end joining protein LigD